MRVLLFGGTGKLGTELRRRLEDCGHFVEAPSRSFLDLRDVRNLTHLDLGYGASDFHVVINAAALTGCERCERDQDEAFLLNCAAPAMLANFAKRLDIPFIHFSTDFVFDGVDDVLEHEEIFPTHTRTMYGWTKAAGEESVLRLYPDATILRLQNIYDETFTGMLDPLKQVAEQSGPKYTVKIIPQRCRPTSVYFVSWVVANMVAAKIPRGIFHLATRYIVSRAEFVAHALMKTGVVRGAELLTFEEFMPTIKRPVFSSLKTDKLEELFQIVGPMIDWRTDFDTNILPLLEKQPATS